MSFTAQREPIPNKEDGGKTTLWRTAIVCKTHNLEVASFTSTDRTDSRKGAWAAFREGGEHCPMCNSVQTVDSDVFVTAQA